MNVLRWSLRAVRLWAARQRGGASEEDAASQSDNKEKSICAHTFFTRSTMVRKAAGSFSVTSLPEPVAVSGMPPEGK
jgi:hypothetical protein